MIAQGDVWWAELPEPRGSGPGFRRPVVVIQSNSLNRSSILTVVCVPLTTNLRWADALGNVLLPARSTGLSRDSVALTQQIYSIDRAELAERVGVLPVRYVDLIFEGIDTVLGRS